MLLNGRNRHPDTGSVFPRRRGGCIPWHGASRAQADNPPVLCRYRSKYRISGRRRVGEAAKVAGKLTCRKGRELHRLRRCFLVLPNLTGVNCFHERNACAKARRSHRSLETDTRQTKHVHTPCANLHQRMLKRATTRCFPVDEN